MATPNVYIFNPTCDMAVLNQSVSYMPPARLRAFEHDLAPIMLWLAEPTDWVVVPTLPHKSFTNRLTEWGIHLPNFVRWDDLKNSKTQLNELRPWGWSPEVHHRLREIKPRCGDAFLRSPSAKWDEGHRHFFSRLTNQMLIDEIVSQQATCKHIAVEHKPVVAKSMQQALDAQAFFNHKAVYKTPWSSSGRGIAIVDTTKQRAVDQRWIEGAIKQQGALIVEPFYDKAHDLSFHFWVSANGDIDYLGHNFFVTDHSGKFQGCHIEEYPQHIGAHNRVPLQAAIKEAQTLLLQILPALHIEQHHIGPVGIDSIWYQNQAGEYKLHPAIEINLRYTMGLVNIKMRNKLLKNGSGTWQISQFESGEWDKFCNDQTASANTSFLPLTPPKGAFGAWANLHVQKPYFS